MNESDLCLVCNKSLTDNGAYLTCVVCEYGYHLGACSGVTKTADFQGGRGKV